MMNNKQFEENSQREVTNPENEKSFKKLKKVF